MSEPKPTYDTEAAEAQPAAIIESPRKVQALKDRGLVEYRVWGWVKISSNFISHINILRGSKLAIWLVISLSIDETGFCDLPLKDLVALSGYSRSEVIESLKELYQLGYLSVEKENGKKSIYNPQFAARGATNPDPSRKTTSPVPTLDSDKNQSSPAEENSTPTFKELKELIEKEIKMNNDLSVWEIADGIFYACKEKGFPISGKQKTAIREWLLTLEDTGKPDKPAKSVKRKEEKVNQDIKTIARARGVSENMISFIDRACKAFGFSIMQIDDVALSVYEWVQEQETKGRTIEDFADWARTDEMGKFIGKYRNSAGNIKNDWARAFRIVSADDRTSIIRRMT